MTINKKIVFFLIILMIFNACSNSNGDEDIRELIYGEWTNTSITDFDNNPIDYGYCKLLIQFRQNGRYWEEIFTEENLNDCQNAFGGSNDWWIDENHEYYLFSSPIGFLTSKAYIISDTLYLERVQRNGGNIFWHVENPGPLMFKYIRSANPNIN